MKDSKIFETSTDAHRYMREQNSKQNDRIYFIAFFGHGTDFKADEYLKNQSDVKFEGFTSNYAGWEVEHVYSIPNIDQASNALFFKELNSAFSWGGVTIPKDYAASSPASKLNVDSGSRFVTPLYQHAQERSSSSINNEMDDNVSQLIMATSINAPGVVSVLLEDNDISINERNKEGNTALMVAAKKGYSEIASMLLKAGAAPQLTNKQGLTAENIARLAGHKHIAADIASMNGMTARNNFFRNH